MFSVDSILDLAVYLIMSRSSNSGFIHFIPLLLIAVAVLAISFSNYKNVYKTNSSNKSVLSESDESKKEETKELNLEKNKDNQELSVEKEEIEEVEDVEEAENVEDVEEEIDDDVNVESEFEQESETISSDGTVNKFKFKLKTKKVNGKTVIETANGNMEIKNNPEDSVENLVNAGILDTPTSFEAKTNDNNKIEFEVRGVEIKKLLGLFEVSLPKTVTVDSETGNVVNSNQSIWIKFLSLLSI